MIKVKGMTVEDILNMDQSEWARLSRADLAKVTRRLADAANKRLRSFEHAEDYSPATEAAKRSGGSFTTGGKNRNQLEHEFARARSFLKAETSTRTGWKNVKDRTIRNFEKSTGVTIPKDQFNEFWEAYEKLRDLDPDIVNRAIKYKAMEELVQKLLDGKTPEEVVSEMHGRISEIYQEAQQERAENGGTAKYFSGQ